MERLPQVSTGTFVLYKNYIRSTTSQMRSLNDKRQKGYFCRIINSFWTLLVTLIKSVQCQGAIESDTICSIITFHLIKFRYSTTRNTFLLIGYICIVYFWQEQRPFVRASPHPLNRCNLYNSLGPEGINRLDP